VEFKEESVPVGKEDVEYRVILSEKKNDSINLQLIELG
jgi:hypothetical protein